MFTGHVKEPFLQSMSSSRSSHQRRFVRIIVTDSAVPCTLLTVRLKGTCVLVTTVEAVIEYTVKEGRLLTKKCTRPFPRAAVFGILARCYGVGGIVGFSPSGQGAEMACDFRR